MRLLGFRGGYETNPRQEALLRGERRARSSFWTKSVKIMNASRKSTEHIRVGGLPKVLGVYGGKRRPVIN